MLNAGCLGKVITVFSITVYKTVITFDAGEPGSRGAGEPGSRGAGVLQPPYLFDVRIDSLSYLRLYGL